MDTSQNVRLNNTLLNSQWVKKKKKIEREIKKCLETNKNGSITYQKLWVPAKVVQKEAYSDKGLY